MTAVVRRLGDTKGTLLLNLQLVDPETTILWDHWAPTPTRQARSRYLRPELLEVRLVLRQRGDPNAGWYWVLSTVTVHGPSTDKDVRPGLLRHVLVWSHKDGMRRACPLWLAALLKDITDTVNKANAPDYLEET